MGTWDDSTTYVSIMARDGSSTMGSWSGQRGCKDGTGICWATHQLVRLIVPGVAPLVEKAQGEGDGIGDGGKAAMVVVPVPVPVPGVPSVVAPVLPLHPSWQLPYACVDHVVLPV